jgi:hypothetical protein
LREQLKNTVPEKDLDNVVDGIYESANDSMTSVVAQELIQSESLRNKHGALYNQILQEINKQIEDVGALSQYTEAQRSQYAVAKAKEFADWVLGEANKRGVVIDEVVKASEIVYQDGKLYPQGVSKKTKLKRLKEKIKSKSEQPIAEEVKLEVVSPVENEIALNEAISEYADIMEYDLGKMSFEEKREIYDQMQRNLFASEEPIVEGEEKITSANDGVVKSAKIEDAISSDKEVDKEKAQNEGRNVIEFNVESLNDKESIDYMRSIATKKYRMSDTEFDDLLSYMRNMADTITKMAKENNHKMFSKWNERSIARYLNEKGNLLPIISAFKTNGDYPMNFDLSSLCTRREATNTVVKHLIDMGYAQQLGTTQIEALKDILRDADFTTACDICFVESKRLRQLAYANTFAYEWESVRMALGITDENEVGTPREFTEEQKAIISEMTSRKKSVRQEAYDKYIPESRKRVFVEGKQIDSGITPDKMKMIATLFKQDSSFAGVFNAEWLMSSYGVDWLMRTYPKTNIRSVLASMYGTATPKPIEGFNIYDPLSWKTIYDVNNKSDKLSKVFAIGGFRGQSFSDFNSLQAFDYFQFFCDLAIRNLPIHMYTKVPSLVELFGETGAMFNMSLVPEIVEGIDKEHAGLKPDGKGGWEYAWSKDSFPIEDAMRLRKDDKFGGRVGTIAVGVSDAHILKMLDDPEIDMIIPYHSSGMPLHTRIKTGLDRARNYEDVQTTKGVGKKDYNYNERLQKIGDPKKTSQDYLDWCKENGFTPKFEEFSHHENYYKLLEDFRGYDNNGKPVLQQAVDMSKIEPESFAKTLDKVLTEREKEVKRQDDIVKEKDVIRKINRLMSKQKIDAEYRTALVSRLKTSLGKDNVKSLRQNEFKKQLVHDLVQTKGKEEGTRQVEIFRKNDGVVYGYTKDNVMYLNENVFNANTPAHEFTHIWSNVAKNINPELWQDGKALLKQSEVWQEVMEDSLYLNIREDEDAVASEVLSRIVGRENEELIRKSIDPKYKPLKEQSAITQRIMEWFKKLWGEVRSLFDYNREGKPLTYEEFIHMPLKDLWEETRNIQFNKSLTGLTAESTPQLMSETKEGLNIDIETKSYTYYYDSLKERQEQGIGDEIDVVLGKKFNEWLKDILEEERINEIETRTFSDLDISLEDFNYDHDTEFETEEEALAYINEEDTYDISNYVRNDISSLDRGSIEGYQRDYLKEIGRDEFFDDYQEMVAGILEENGFNVEKNYSNISQSRYLKVYKGDELISNIRISDHDTHKFYGYNINLYTNEPIDQELAKLKRAFAEGDFGIDETVYSQVTNLPKQENKLKGSFDVLTKSIKITSEADFSTYSHEFAHFFLDNIWNYVNSGMASEKYIKEFEGIKKWLGVKGNYPTRSQHEKFARAYEKYLYKGTNADAPIGQAFKDYENFIREVYSSIAEIDTRAGLKYRAVPKLVYDFFDSMTSGTLPFYGDIEEPEKEVKKEVKEVKEFVAEETKILEENRANYNLKPVETDIKKSYLTAYFKMTGEEVEAGTTTHEYQEKRAMSFIESDLARADRIAEGKELLPDDILDTAFNIMYARVQKRLGNRDKYAKALLNASMELRRYGQEIEATKLAYQDEKESAYWINKVMTSKAEALADSNSLKLKDMNTKIEKTIKAGMKDGKSAKDIAKELRNELGVTELFQEEVYPTNETDVASYNYIYKYVNEQLGLSMSMAEAETITRKADDMLASLENSMAKKNGNPSVDFFIKQKDLENYANSLAPSSNARVLVSVIGRGNLLTSIKSPFTNIENNIVVGILRAITRRFKLQVGKSIVSPELIAENKQYSYEIWKKTGYNVNNITPETPRNTILGEKITHSEGEGTIRWFGKLYEESIYKWGLGWGDVKSKDFAFTDYVALKATKLANGDVNKANAIFKDACLIDPQTDDGKEIRQEAIQESLIATYQNKGLLSESLLKYREGLSFGVGFGEFLVPFVKTPANVKSMELKTGFGLLKAIPHEIIKDVKAVYRIKKENPNKSLAELMKTEDFKKAIKPLEKNIELVTQNSLGLAIAWAIASALDDDDYMPSYAFASSKDKQLAKELNIPFNAIRIGDTWISLDYFGALASPLVGWLQARREESFFAYLKTAGVQVASLPGLGNIADLYQKVEGLAKKSKDEVVSETGDALMEQLYVRSIPAIFSDIAKALDSYERETKGDEIITKIPFARERAFEKISVTSGKAEELGNPIYDILFGSRVKEQVSNDVADELQRLNNAGWGVSLTTVTRSGLLSELDDDTKQKVREDFAEEYSKQVKRLIKTPRYKRLSDEDKQESINKIRRSIVERLKKRYLKKRKK